LAEAEGFRRLGLAFRFPLGLPIFDSACGFGGVLSATRKAAVARLAVSWALYSSVGFVMAKKSPRTGLDPLKIFQHATGFHNCYLRLLNSVPTDAPAEIKEQDMGIISMPTMALSAFTSELYLKCLLCVETAGVPDGHNLKMLFGLLQAPIKREIDDLWDAHIRQPHKLIMIEQMRTLPKGENLRLDLRYALDVGADSFLDLRYFYEKEQVFFLLSDLPTLLRIVILKRFPGWALALPKPSIDLTR
jgi:hypothetical protein